MNMISNVVLKKDCLKVKTLKRITNVIDKLL